MELSDLVELERVHIQKETPESYIARYNDETYEISKSTETSFVLNGPSSGQSMKLRPCLENKIVPETEIFQDEFVPDEFKEVMMFHEIREMEYKGAGFDDAHKRAVNDEILYALKFFGENLRNQYFEFAEAYRTNKRETMAHYPEYAKLKQRLQKGENIKPLDLQIFYCKCIQSLRPFWMNKAKEIMELSKVRLTPNQEGELWDSLLERGTFGEINLSAYIPQFRDTICRNDPKDKILKFYNSIINQFANYQGNEPSVYERNMQQLFKSTGIKPTDEQAARFSQVMKEKNAELDK